MRLRMHLWGMPQQINRSHSIATTAILWLNYSVTKSNLMRALLDDYYRMAISKIWMLDIIFSCVCLWFMHHGGSYFEMRIVYNWVDRSHSLLVLTVHKCKIFEREIHIKYIRDSPFVLLVYVFFKFPQDAQLAGSAWHFLEDRTETPRSDLNLTRTALHWTADLGDIDVPF